MSQEIEQYDQYREPNRLGSDHKDFHNYLPDTWVSCEIFLHQSHSCDGMKRMIFLKSPIDGCGRGVLGT